MTERLRILNDKRLKKVNEALIKECISCWMTLAWNETNAELCTLINTH